MTSRARQCRDMHVRPAAPPNPQVAKSSWAQPRSQKCHSVAETDVG